MHHAIFTIGHSNHSIEQFLRPLAEHQIDVLIDVRSYPRSKRYPHFSKTELIAHLKSAGIAYRWSGKSLGGMRKASGPNPHTAISAASLKAFAVHMATPLFTNEMERVFELSQNLNSCLMCAEADPYSCHRQLIADYATIARYPVKHLNCGDDAQSHQLSDTLNIENGHLVYNKNSQQELF